MREGAKVALPAIEALLRQAIGLDVQSIGRNSLARAVEQRRAAVALDDVADYLGRLRESAEERQQLIETLVVPETWFFRHPDAFAELAALSAPWLSGERGSFRVLSVPCSTGEEAYSIAITLLDRGMPRQLFTVDAMDISRRHLAVAEHGTFGANSFRSDSMPGAPHFERVRRGYQVAPAVQRQVRFIQGNLLAPEAFASGETYHAVFCRNLLIYFDQDNQQRALRTLARLLAEDGVLFVGPADGFAALTSGLEPAGRPGAFAFRRPAHPRRAHGHRAAATRPPAARAGRTNQQRRAAVKGPGATAPVSPAQHASPPARATALDEARTLADAGRIAEAAAACERHLQAAGPSADAYYLLAVVADALDDRQRAVDLYRKALYLEPRHAEALAQLSLLTAQRGDGERAGLLAARARRAADQERRQGRLQ